MLLQKKNRKLFISLICFVFFVGLINGLINSYILNNPVLYWGFEFFQWIVIPLIVLLLLIRYGSLRLQNIGINREIFGKKSIFFVVMVCIIICSVDYLIYSLIYSFSQHFFNTTPYFTYHSVMPANDELKILVAIYFGLTAGVVEEFYYRGLFYQASHFFAHPSFWYLMISPVAFSLIHWEGGLASVVSTYIFGILACLFFLWTKNLWPLIIGHTYTDVIWYS